MYKIIPIFFLALFLATPAPAADLWPLPKTKWGMSLNKAAATLKTGRPASKDQTIITHDDGQFRYKGVPYTLYTKLSFSDNKLQSIEIAICALEDRALTPQERDDISSFLKDTFTRQYGAPVYGDIACPENKRTDCKMWGWNKKMDTVAQLTVVQGPPPQVTVYYYSGHVAF